MNAIIMAGGKGTRLQKIAAEMPKPLVPICGKPILQHQIENLKSSGITEIIIIIGHLGNKIKDYFKDGSEYGLKISYIEEDIPLGTAGALYYLKSFIKNDFFLIFGDLMVNIDWMRMYEYHKKNEARITLLAHPNSHPYDSDLLIVDESSRLISLEPKNQERNFYYRNLVNAGIYIINPSVLDCIRVPEKLDFEKDILSKEIDKDSVYTYCSSEYVKDMGTIERLESVTSDYKNGTVEQKNLINKQKCIFLDRDGTINQLKGFISRHEDFTLIEGVAEAIKSINKSQFLCVVITNQPVLARGECKEEELTLIHNKMETTLGLKGAYVDAIYYCPHHPDKGYAGEVKELKIECNCRKPQIGMLERAAEEYNIDLIHSWFIGDTTIDIQTGKNAGCKTALVLTGEKGKDNKYPVKPDFIFNDLNTAIQFILEEA